MFLLLDANNIPNGDISTTNTTPANAITATNKGTNKKKSNVRTKLKFSVTKLASTLEKSLNLNNYINDSYIYYDRYPYIDGNFINPDDKYEIEKFIYKEKDGIPLTCLNNFKNLNCNHICKHNDKSKIIEKVLQLRSSDEQSTIIKICLECGNRTSL